ncbi:MAG: hypothetical protein H6858_06880 [Rhodospirillales bacterium]|nr:hypothetical protein [Alphaproteobacteria bacterium]MCB9977303.1 hypothetical protein [Rhodospirillales bacterium]
MTKRVSPSIANIRREVRKNIRTYFQELADEFGADNFNPDELSENVAVFFALAAHHPQEAILSAFPDVKDENGIRHRDSEARGWIGNDTKLALAVFGTARSLNISKTDMGYQEADFG